MMETPDDPVAAARAAGLRYTPDIGPGITRRRAGKGWSYIDPDGVVIRDAKELQRIRALVIPPAWTNVWINPNPRGHIQATGRDARGRKQYRYHAKWRATRDETKFSRMIAFGEALPRIRERVAADLELPGLPREKTLAIAVRLLDEALIRVGNAEYARENDSYGLTTLRDDHVDVSGSTVHFTFRGKSGKTHEIDVRDRRVARIISRMQDLPGQHLFQYLDADGEPHAIGSEDVNAYLQEIAGEAFTAKDFRTWGGTVLAARSLREHRPLRERDRDEGEHRHRGRRRGRAPRQHARRLPRRVHPPRRPPRLRERRALPLRLRRHGRTRSRCGRALGVGVSEDEGEGDG